MPNVPPLCDVVGSMSGLNISPYALDPTYLPEVCVMLVCMHVPELYCRCVVPLKSPEFIFPVERKKKSWNEKMFDRTGTSYLAGKLR